MLAQTDVGQSLVLEVEVVEILERRGRLLARVRIEPGSVLDLAASGIRELHLGDRLVVAGALVVDSVAQATHGASRESG